MPQGMGPQRGAGVPSVEQLLHSKTFLEGLSAAERASIFKSANVASSRSHSNTRPQQNEAAEHSAVKRDNGPTNSPRSSWSPSKDLLDHMADLSPQHMALLCTSPATSPHRSSTSPIAHWDSLRQQSHVLLADNEQLQHDNIVLQKQKEQLQAKVTALQNQVSLLLAHQRAAEEGKGRMAALESIISKLQSTVMRVGSMAGKAAADNKAALAENQQLSAERTQLLDMVHQLKTRNHELEGTLLAQLTSGTKDAADGAAGAAFYQHLGPLQLPVSSTAAAPKTKAVQHAALRSAGSSAAKIGPALQEISALKRVRDSLQRQVTKLEQQLSVVEHDAQTAAAAAASERARAGRTESQLQQKLAAAMQRLEAVAAREQQQAATLQERETYIARLEQCLLNQHQQLSSIAAAAVSKSKQAELAASCKAQEHCAAAEAEGVTPESIVRPCTQTASLGGTSVMCAAGVLSPQLQYLHCHEQQQHVSTPESQSLRATTAAIVGTSGTSAEQQQQDLTHGSVSSVPLLQQQQQQQPTVEVANSVIDHTLSPAAAAAAAATRAAVAKQCMSAMLRGSSTDGSGLAASDKRLDALQQQQWQWEAQLKQQRQVGTNIISHQQPTGRDLPAVDSDTCPEARAVSPRQSVVQQLHSLKSQHSQQQQVSGRKCGSAAPPGKANSSSAAGSSSSNALKYNKRNSSNSAWGYQSGGSALCLKTSAAGAPDGLSSSSSVGARTSQLQLLHQQRQRRLRELLQQKQQRQQQHHKLQHTAAHVQQRQQQHDKHQQRFDADDEQQQQDSQLQQEVEQVEAALTIIQSAGRQREQQHDSWQQHDSEQAAQLGWQQLQQQLNISSSTAADRQLEQQQWSRTAVTGCTTEMQNDPHQQHRAQEHVHVVQEPSFAAGLRAAENGTAASGCAEYIGANAPCEPVRHKTLTVSAGQDQYTFADFELSAASAAMESEARLVAKVLDMQRNLQAIEGQLMREGCQKPR